MINFKNILPRDKKATLKLALDIGSANLKIALLSKKEGVIKLENFLVRPIASQENLQEVIKKLLAELDGSVKIANASVSGDGIVLRHIFMPFMNKDEFASSIRFEASKHMSIDFDKFLLESVILKSDCPDSKMLVLLVAIEKSVVEERIKLLRECGLNLRVIDVDCLAAINSFEYFYYAVNAKKDDKQKNEAVIVLDIGAKRSSISFLLNGVLYFTRFVPIAGKEFDKRLSLKLNINDNEARKMKEELAVNQNSEAKGVLTQAYGELINEIQVSLDYFESHFNASAKKMFLLGGGSKTFGLREAIVSALGIEVVEPDISNGILVGDNLKDKIKDNSAFLSVVLGLGLRDD